MIMIGLFLVFQNKSHNYPNAFHESKSTYQASSYKQTHRYVPYLCTTVTMSCKLFRNSKYLDICSLVAIHVCIFFIIHIQPISTTEDLTVYRVTCSTDYLDQVSSIQNSVRQLSLHNKI